MLILKQCDVQQSIDGNESQIVDLIRRSYRLHNDGKTIVPPSAFLRLSDNTRAIGLPASIEGTFGLKWVSSFPENLDIGLPRAIATIILNSPETGVPLSFMDGTLISATRTAASAAFAATVIADPDSEVVGFAGTGPINQRIADFLLACCPAIRRFLTFDAVPERAAAMAARFAQKGVETNTVCCVEKLFRECRIVSIATNQVRPHIYDIPQEFDGGTILHISLRDLAPELIASAYNVVDDVDQVCQHQTSVHLAEQLYGHREFIHDTIGGLIDRSSSKTPGMRFSIFSPFGLGALDVMLANFVYESSVSKGIGTRVSNMFGAE